MRSSKRSLRRRFLHGALLERLESRQVLAAPQAAWFADSPTKTINEHVEQPAVRTADFVGPTESQELDWVVQLTPAAAGQVQNLVSIDRLLSEGDIAFQTLRGLGTTGLVHVRSLTASQSKVEDLLAHSQSVASFQINQVVTSSQVPNDSDFGNQFGLSNQGQFGWQVDADIDAPEAWDQSIGSWHVVVGVIDSGIDVTHPDLYRNIWINQGEIPDNLVANLIDVDNDRLITFADLNTTANAAWVRDKNGNGFIDADDLLEDSLWTDGLDTDDNGFVDDVFGWNFRPSADDSLAPNNPTDISGHGTHVAGIIGASGNNARGVSGINWQTSLMSLRFLDQNNQGDVASAIAAFNYATMMRTQFDTNVRVLNASWGQAGSPVTELQDAISSAGSADILVVAAAGNGNVLGIGVDNDRTPFYPASYPVDNIVSVAASNGNDALASFSNFGAQSVDMVAPGVGILSTLPGGQYGEANGTSMAAPMVSGAAALLWSALPRASMPEVRQALLQSVDAKANLSGLVASGGRLNAATALSARTFAPTVTLDQASNITSTGNADKQIYVTYTDRNGIDLASLGNDDLRVEHMWGSRETLTAQLQPGSITANAERSIVSATYLVTAPGGTWDVLDFGQYTISSMAGAVLSSGSLLSTRTEELGSFRVQIVASDVLYISTYADTVEASGALSLRQALQIASTQPASELTILLDSGRYTLDIPYQPDPSFVFATPVSSACWTDTNSPVWSNATTGDFDIQGMVTIIGNDAQSTIIDGQALDRVFKVHAGAELNLKRVGIVNGQAPAGQGGAGILSAGTLTLDQVVMSNHNASDSDNQAGHGGAVAIWDGQATVNQSRITANTAQVGGGLYACGPANFSITGSTIDNNRGGGVASHAQVDSAIDASTISDNFGPAIDSQARDFNGQGGIGRAPVISRDGSRIAFLSSSTNLVAADTNSAIDGFVFNISDGRIERISQSSTGQSANQESRSLALTSDGGQVAFATPSGNLTSGDNNFTNDIFVRDTSNHVTSLVSTTGSTSDTTRDSVAISADGQIVAYQQSVADDSNNNSAVIIADRISGQIERISLQLVGGGIAKLDFLDQLALSADGHYLVIGAGRSGTANGRFHELYLYDRLARTLKTLPVRPGGTQPNGSLFSPSISDDGRFIAFAADDSNLVTDDTNAVTDIFVFDQQSATTERISLSATHTQANQASIQPSISSSGRYIAYSSAADNLVASDTNGRADIFVFDRVTGEVQIVSQAAASIPANGDSSNPSISGDGQRVAFVSTANNLVSAHPNHRPAISAAVTQVYVADRTTNIVSSVSSFIPTSTLLVTNSTLAFNTGSTTVSGNVTVGNSLLAGNITELDFGARSFSLGYNIYASNSDTARLAATDIRNVDTASRLSEFTSLAGLPPGYQLLQGNPAINAGNPQAATSMDQWQRSRPTPDIGALEAVSGSLSGYVFVDLNNNRVQDSNEPGLSDQQVYLDVNADGIFQSGEPTTLTSTSNEPQGAGYYRFDHLSPTQHSVRLVVPNQWTIVAPATVRVGQGNSQSNGPSQQAMFGPSGDTVAFVSKATNLVSGDTSAENIFIFSRTTGALEKVPKEGANLKLLGIYGSQDQSVLLRDDTGVYLYDRQSQTTQLLSVSNSGQPANFHSDWGAMSSSGRWVVYSSFATNLVSDDNDNFADIYLLDRDTQNVISVTRQARGVQGNNDSEWPVISDDGSTIVFVSDASNLVDNDTNGVSDIFVYSTVDQTLRRVSVGTGGVQSNGFAYPPKLSGNGRYVVFQSIATNLAPGGPNGASNLFVVDLQTSSLERLNVPFKASTQSINYAANISFDGQYVSFEANNTVLNSPLATTAKNVFVYDRFWSAAANTAQLIVASQSVPSVGTSPSAANGSSIESTFSRDGRWLAFQSLASNLVTNDTNQLSDIFIAANPLESSNRSAVLQVGQQLSNLNYPLAPQPGTLAGVLFNDQGEDLVYDLGDPTLAGWVVYLDSNFNGRRDVGEPSTVSDSDGSYRFTAVPTQRDLALGVEVPSNWQQVAPGTNTIRLFLPAGGQSLQRNFAFRLKSTTGQSANSRVDGRVFNDLNRDGIQQPGEAGMPLVDVYLDLDEDGVRDADEQRLGTDSQGNYSFTRLDARSYVVRTILDEGTSITAPLGNSFQQLSVPIVDRSTAIDSPQDLLLADLDGLNGPDIVVALYFGNRLTIQLNNGLGQFPSVIKSQLPPGDSAPLALAAAQLNGREGVDLIVANGSSGTVSVLLDFRGQDFQQKYSLTVGKDLTLRTAGLADLDNDGDQDLIATTGDATAASQIHTFFNDGTGRFTKGASYAAQGKLPVALVTGDFNRDGRMDVAVANQGFQGNGANIAVLLGIAGGRLATATLTNAGISSSDIEAADLNGDSWLDLVTTNYSLNTASVLQGSSSGTFTVLGQSLSVPAGPFHLKLSDIEGDGDQDILVSNLASTNISVIRNQHNRTGNNSISFQPAESFAVTNFPTGPRVAFGLDDLDNNGTLDIALTNSSSTSVKILSNRIMAGGNRVQLNGTNIVVDQNFGLQTEILLPKLGSVEGPAQFSEDTVGQSLTLNGLVKGRSRTTELRVTASSNNPAVIALQQQVLTPAASLSFDLTPQPNASGVVVVSLEIRDPGADQTMDTADDGVITRSHSITVSPVNDAPTFSLAGNQVITIGSDLRTVNRFASGFAPGGGSDESAQTIAEYLVSTDRTDLFLVQPAIDNLGHLRFQPRTETGLATITVQVRDSGGTLSGGIDRSLPQTFQILITDLADSEIDFGDAPTTYPVTIAQAGARHKLNGLYLGSAVDAEANGQPSADAKGDDNSFDDEDGIQFIMPPLTMDNQPTISSMVVTVTRDQAATARLDAWIDFNGNGDWQDTNEQIFSSVSVKPGINLLSYVVPARAQAGVTFARFRLSSSGGLSPTGLAEGGEVEDYQVTIISGSQPQSLTVRTELLGNHQWSISNGQLNMDVAGKTLFAAPANVISQVQGLSGAAELYVMRQPATNLLGRLNAEVATGSVNLLIDRADTNLASLTSDAFSGVDAILLDGAAGQVLQISATDVSKLSGNASLSLQLGPGDKLLTTSNWQLEDRQLRAGNLMHQFKSDTAVVWIDNSTEWQNALSQFDVSGDATLSPIDALLVINYLNRLTVTGGNQVPTLDPTKPKEEGFVDVNGNNLVTAIDALLVINELNS